MTTEQAVTHTSTLVEQHRITIPVGATDDNVAVARLHAEAYARARGFEISPGSFSVIAATPNGMPMVGKGGYLGVSFEVVVGKGDIALDQRTPGVLDSWTWSGPAVEWWRRIFNRADGRQGKLIAERTDGKASVTRIHPHREDTLTGVMQVDRGEIVGESEVLEPGDWRGAEALRGFGVSVSQTRCSECYGLGPDHGGDLLQAHVMTARSWAAAARRDHLVIDRGQLRLQLGLLLGWFGLLSVLVVTGVYPV